MTWRFDETDDDGRRADRGQTLPDYVTGVAVFFITIAAILGLLPSFVTPFQSDVAGQDTALADRISQDLVANLSVDGEPNTLQRTAVEAVMELSAADINDRFGLPDYKNVNVTVRTLNGSEFVVNSSSGDGLHSAVSYDGQAAASGVRIVKFDDGTSCTPACRLLVRVW